VIVIVATGLTPLLAVSVMGYCAAVPGPGVPLIAPVLVSSAKPDGSVPALSATAGGGVPVTTRA
jgi:hypothetical protein